MALVPMKRTYKYMTIHACMWTCPQNLQVFTSEMSLKMEETGL